MQHQLILSSLHTKMNPVSCTATGNVSVSTALRPEPRLVNLDQLLIKKPERWQTIRAMLPVEFLQTLSPAALRAASDGNYFVQTPAELRDFKRLAAELAKTNMPISRIGRSTQLAQLMREYRK